MEQLTFHTFVNMRYRNDDNNPANPVPRLQAAMQDG